MSYDDSGKNIHQLCEKSDLGGLKLTSLRNGKVHM